MAALVGLWVSELRVAGKRPSDRQKLKCKIVDLNDVRLSIERVKKALRTMSKEGVHSSLAVSTSSICFKRGLKDETTRRSNCAGPNPQTTPANEDQRPRCLRHTAVGRKGDILSSRPRRTRIRQAFEILVERHARRLFLQRAA